MGRFEADNKGRERERRYKMLVKFNPVVFRTLLKNLNPKEGEAILDIGCGEGIYLRKIKERASSDVVGIDSDGRAVAAAVDDGVALGDAANLNFEGAVFDKVYSLDVIEHVPDSKRFITEVERVLKPGGVAVLVYPWEPFRGFQAFFSSFLMYGNVFKAVDIHVHMITPRKIKKLAEGTRLSIVKNEFILNFGFFSFPVLKYLTVLKKEKA